MLRSCCKWFAVAVAAALAGCAHFDERTPTAPLRTAATLGTQPIAIDWPRDAWWQRYGDPQLDQLISEALDGSPTLTVARARVARATAAAGVARSALLPQVNGNATIDYQRFSENYIFPPPYAGSWRTDNRATLDFTYEFDFWNKNGAALEAALSQTQAAAADEQQARVVLATGVAQAYFNLQRLFAQRDVSLAAITQREEVVRITRQRFEAGLDTRIEVKQAEGALATVKTELAQYNGAISAARNQIAALTGAGPDRGEAIVARPADERRVAARPAAIPLDLVAHRADVTASRWRVEAAQHDIDVAKAMFYPNVNLAAFAGLSSLGLASFVTGGSVIAGIAPALHLPIFEGGRLNANLQGKDADANAAIGSYNQAVIEAVHDVADVLSGMDGLAKVRVEQAIARDATTDAYNTAVIRYRAGLGNYLTVLTAQTQQLVQDRLDADLHARAFELDVNLVRALGGGYVDPAPVAALAAPVTAAR
jgi:NodT family efflux transporter outer membrane factor (OMF) lipoprotein